MIIANVEQNEYSFEGSINVIVYHNGKLIYVMPERQPGLPPSEFESMSDAMARLRQCYPDVQQVFKDYNAFEQAYHADGYHYPGRYSLRTDLLCATCEAEVKLQPRSRNAGMDAPYNALVHTYFQCSHCQMEYVYHRDGWYGPSWWARKNADQSWNEAQDCDEPPHIPPVNPYGFRELILIPNSQPEEETDEEPNNGTQITH